MKTIKYWRNPTKWEISFGEGAIHYLTVNVNEVTKKNGYLKKIGWEKLIKCNYTELEIK